MHSMRLLLVSVLMTVAPHVVVAQTPSAEGVVAIKCPLIPLPAEAASANATRFSFIVYGDTRGRRDGVDPQYEHSLVVESMLATIGSLKNGPDAVRFVLQSGDAVVNGRDPKQWNVSFVGLINRLTTEAGVPYYLVPGNHDVTAAGDPQRGTPGWSQELSPSRVGIDTGRWRHPSADRLSLVCVRLRQRVRSHIGFEHRG